MIVVTCLFEHVHNWPFVCFNLEKKFQKFGFVGIFFSYSKQNYFNWQILQRGLPSSVSNTAALEKMPMK